MMIIRLLMVLALLTCASTIVDAQTYPDAEVFKTFHSEVYDAAVAAHKTAKEAESTLPGHIATMAQSERELRNALKSEEDFTRFAVTLANYVAASELVRTTGDMVFDTTILVTIVGYKHHPGDRAKLNALVEWLKETQAVQKKIDAMLPKANARLIQESFKKYKELEEKSKK